MNHETDDADEPPAKPTSKVDSVIAAAHPEKLRRSERVFLRIPLQVQGKNEAGQPFSEQTATLVVNRHGARIGLKAAVRLEDRITVTNLQNSMSCPFRVVARMTQNLGEGPEWGIECLQPELNFWGISFPEKFIPRTPKPAASEGVDALLECSQCREREFAQLTLDNYRQLAVSKQLERWCRKCSQQTVWGFGFVETEAEEWSFVVPDKEPADENRRAAKRVAIKLPVKISLPDGSEEVTRTENISKTGVCFSSSLDLSEGDRIQVAVGYANGSAAAIVEARVVWRREFEAGRSTLYGVQLEKPEVAA